MLKKVYHDQDQKVNIAQWVDQLQDTYGQQDYRAEQTGDEYQKNVQLKKGGLFHKIVAMQKEIMIEIRREEDKIQITLSKRKWPGDTVIFSIIAVIIALAVGIAINAFTNMEAVEIRLAAIAIAALAVMVGLGIYSQHRFEKAVMQSITLPSTPLSEANKVVEGSAQPVENSPLSLSPSNSDAHSEAEKQDLSRKTTFILIILIFIIICSLWMFFNFTLFSMVYASLAILAIQGVLTAAIVNILRYAIKH